MLNTQDFYQQIIENLSDPPTDWWSVGLTITNILIFIGLTVLTWKTSKKLGETQIALQKEFSKTQIELQKNAQKIDLFDRYSTIHHAFQSDLANLSLLEWKIRLNYDSFKLEEDFPIEIQRILPNSELLLNPNESKNLSKIAQHLGNIKIVISVLIRKIDSAPEHIKDELFKPILPKVDQNYEQMTNEISREFYPFINKYNLLNERGINTILESKKAISDILEACPLQESLKEYCTINNILVNKKDV